MDDSELDPLYEKPVAEFVSARNDLSKALKLAGRKDDAKRVKALAKPSLPAWTINQLVRRKPELVKDLFAALDGVRAAQLGGQNDTRLSLAEATATERGALAAMSEAAVAILEHDGHAASKNTLDRVVRSLRAMAIDVPKREVLLKGQLTEDTQDDAFFGLAEQLAGTILPPAIRPVDPVPTPTPTPPVTPPPKPEPQLPPPIDLDKERRRREAIEAAARAKALQDKIAAGRRALDAFRLVNEKLERDLEKAELDLSEARRRTALAEEGMTKALSKHRAAQAQYVEMRNSLADLEAEDDASQNMVRTPRDEDP